MMVAISSIRWPGRQLVLSGRPYKTCIALAWRCICSARQQHTRGGIFGRRRKSAGGARTRLPLTERSPGHFYHLQQQQQHQNKRDYVITLQIARTTQPPNLGVSNHGENFPWIGREKSTRIRWSSQDDPWSLHIRERQGSAGYILVRSVHYDGEQAPPGSVG